ncbi:unnamed protein product [Paramecium sonneborni]|uniref:Cyclic nucleotide-binding domain-containing protein n=1 Tax=Paramecium sonneborni TaxID=65129 RepID=A0A8S1P4S1_9CILI|nr:unnamed protein product [Paramecium sonneborni]
MQLSKKFEEFQDLDPIENFPQRRISRTMGYQNSKSIQEEDEEQSSSSMQQPKPKFPKMNSSIQQPCDLCGSDMKVPTIYTNMHSNKSFDKNPFQQESKIKVVENNSGSRLIDVSVQEPQDSLQSESIKSQLMDKNKSVTLNSVHVKNIVNKFVQRMKRNINWNQLKDITLIDDLAQIQPQLYKWFTISYFSLTSLIILTSSIFIPLHIAEQTGFEILTYLIHCLSILQIVADIHFKRGPFHLSEGKFNNEYFDNSKIILDISRLTSGVVLIFSYQYDLKYLIVPYIILQLIRQGERFENIYTSTQLIIYILILWIALIMTFACLLESDEGIHYSISLAISILTHNGTIYIEVTTQNALLLQSFMIISSITMIYTASTIFIWIKPTIKLEEEKEKHLASFLNGIKDKKIEYGLQCRCYSYLEYVIDEDIIKTRDLLAKKLSPGLQEELQISIRSKMVDKIKLFDKFTSSLKQQLIYWFDMAQYNPEENIVQEHQVEDFCLYYILKGKVKIQFQGYFQGKPKRTFHTLSEGQTFGEFSFVSGIPPYISINSQGLSTVLKLRRSDFLEIIKTFPQDNEIFCLFKDNCYQNHNMFECHYCKIKGHLLFECQYLQYYPKRLNVIEKHIYPHPQQRFKCERKHKEPKALLMLFIVGERAKQYQQKLSQEVMTSEDFPMSSQLPYSESIYTFDINIYQIYIDQTQQSASYLSKTQSIHKYSPEHLSDNPDSDGDQLYEEQAIDPVLNNQLRKQQNKTTLRTAGFPFMSETLGTKVNKPMIENLHKEKLQVITEQSQSKQLDSLNSKQEDTNQLSKQSSGSQAFAKKNHLYTAARSMHTKLTFRYQQQQSGQMEDQIQFQQQQQNSIRQTSNRSNTYSNPLSNNLSNNPSSNSKANTKSARVSPTQFQQPPPQKKKEDRASHSDQSLSEQQRHTNRKKSTKTGTKVSILNQMSQFQIINTPENHNYQYNDIVLNRFEKMHLFKYYNPHNNYDNVIVRYNQQSVYRMNKFHRLKKSKPIHYTIKCYVSSKIKKVKRILESQL